MTSLDHVRENCLRSVSAKDVKVLRTRYWTKPGFQRSQWLLHTLTNADVKRRFRYLCTNNGKKKIFHINKNKLTKYPRLQEKDAICYKGIQPRP